MPTGIGSFGGIRRVVLDDVAAVAALEDRALETWSHWVPDSLVRFDYEWAHRIVEPANTTLVAVTTGDAVCGVCSIGPERFSHEPSLTDPDSAHMYALFVDPRLHGSGVAAELAAETLAAVVPSGYTTCRLWAPANAGRALGFYRKTGWRTTGRTTGSSEFERLELRIDISVGRRPR